MVGASIVVRVLGVTNTFVVLVYALYCSMAGSAKAPSGSMKLCVNSIDKTLPDIPLCARHLEGTFMIGAHPYTRNLSQLSRNAACTVCIMAEVGKRCVQGQGRPGPCPRDDIRQILEPLVYVLVLQTVLYARVGTSCDRLSDPTKQRALIPRSRESTRRLLGELRVKWFKATFQPSMLCYSPHPPP